MSSLAQECNNAACRSKHATKQNQPAQKTIVIINQINSIQPQPWEFEAKQEKLKRKS